LSREEVAELVAPHPDTLRLVKGWLEHNGVNTSTVFTSHGGSWLTVPGVPVLQANNLLGASYQLYQHSESKETILRTYSYSIPIAFPTHVETVAPTTCFSSPGTLRKAPRKRQERARPVLSSRDDLEAVTPSYLRRLYNTETYKPVSSAKNMLGIVGFHEYYPSPDDLMAFMSRYRSDGIDASYRVEEINDGGYVPNEPHPEPSLDMQYSQGMAWPIQHVFYSTGGLPSQFIPDGNQPENENEPFLDWADHMMKLPEEDLPRTVSISYGGDEQTFPRDYAESICELFEKLAVRGVSILIASGDLGVGGGDCERNDGSGSVEFLPIFPSTCTRGHVSSVVTVYKYRNEWLTTFQVPISPASVGRRANYRRSQRSTPLVASQTILSGRTTRRTRCLLSSKNSAERMQASTSGFAAVI